MLEFRVNDNSGNKSYNVLSINNKAYYSKIPTLIDTGAFIPVYTGRLIKLKRIFGNSIRETDIQAIIGGFGMIKEVANVYIISNFKLSDGKSAIVYKNLYIAHLYKDLLHDMILSFSMVNAMNMNYVLYNKNNEKINPLLRLYPRKSLYTMSPVIKKCSGSIAINNIGYNITKSYLLVGNSVFVQ